MTKELYRLPSARRTSTLGIFFAAASAVFMVVLASIWIATELTAWRLGFARELGTSLVAVPEAWTAWLRAAAILLGGVALAILLQSGTRRHAKIPYSPAILVGGSSLVLSTPLSIFSSGGGALETSREPPRSGTPAPGSSRCRAT